MILYLMTLVCLNTSAQSFGSSERLNDYIYFKSTFDPNQAFGIIDNPRTNKESYGLDYDIELGARWKSVGVYMFYGSYQEIDYQNFGIGFDVYVNWLSNVKCEVNLYNPFTGRKGTWFKIQGIDLSVGGNIGLIGRKHYGYKNRETWGFSIAPAIRGTATFWLSDGFGFNLTAQGQNRPDLGLIAIFEGHAGVVFRFHNKPIKSRFR